MGKEINLVKTAVETFVTFGKKPVVRAGCVICDDERFKGIKLEPELLQIPQGVFVLIKKNGALRGLMGIMNERKNNLAELLLSQGISAASQDVRFEPVTEDELPELEYKVLICKNKAEVKKELVLKNGFEKESVYRLECGCRMVTILPENFCGTTADSACKENDINLDEDFSVIKWDCRQV